MAVSGQKAIARQLNISVATVSRSLQNDPSVSPQTRAEVTALASASGYRPRRYQRRKRSAAVRQISFLAWGQPGVDTVSEHYINATRMLRGMVEAAQNHGAAVHVNYVPPENVEKIDDPRFQPVDLRERLVQGAILAGYFPSRAVSGLARCLPVVRMVHHEMDTALDCIGVDDRRSMAQLIQHLLELGHRNIGFLGNGESRGFIHARFAGYVEALSIRDLEYNPANVVNLRDPRHDPEHDAELVVNRMNDGVSAWIAATDAAAYDLAEALLRRGISVPRDLSLCGIDNFPARPKLPKLTSMDLPFEDMGAAAVQRLLRRIDRPQLEPIHILHGCRLMIGESTAPI